MVVRSTLETQKNKELKNNMKAKTIKKISKGGSLDIQVGGMEATSQDLSTPTLEGLLKQSKTGANIIVDNIQRIKEQMMLTDHTSLDAVWKSHGINFDEKGGPHNSTPVFPLSRSNDPDGPHTNQLMIPFNDGDNLLEYLRNQELTGKKEYFIIPQEKTDTQKDNVLSVTYNGRTQIFDSLFIYKEDDLVSVYKLDDTFPKTKGPLPLDTIPVLQAKLEDIKIQYQDKKSIKQQKFEIKAPPSINSKKIVYDSSVPPKIFIQNGEADFYKIISQSGNTYKYLPYAYAKDEVKEPIDLSQDFSNTKFELASSSDLGLQNASISDAEKRTIDGLLDSLTKGTNLQDKRPFYKGQSTEQTLKLSFLDILNEYQYYNDNTHLVNKLVLPSNGPIPGLGAKQFLITDTGTIYLSQDGQDLWTSRYPTPQGGGGNMAGYIPKPVVDKLKLLKIFQLENIDSSPEEQNLDGLIKLSQFTPVSGSEYKVNQIILKIKKLQFISQYLIRINGKERMVYDNFLITVPNMSVTLYNGVIGEITRTRADAVKRDNDKGIDTAAASELASKKNFNDTFFGGDDVADKEVTFDDGNKMSLYDAYINGKVDSIVAIDGKNQSEIDDIKKKLKDPTRIKNLDDMNIKANKDIHKRSENLKNKYQYKAPIEDTVNTYMDGYFTKLPNETVNYGDVETTLHEKISQQLEQVQGLKYKNNNIRILEQIDWSDQLKFENLIESVQKELKQYDPSKEDEIKDYLKKKINDCVELGLNQLFNERTISEAEEALNGTPSEEDVGSSSETDSASSPVVGVGDGQNPEKQRDESRNFSYTENPLGAGSVEPGPKETYRYMSPLDRGRYGGVGSDAKLLL